MTQLLPLSDDERGFFSGLGISSIADDNLWAEALTHGSAGTARDYQRLEFLGDRVLGLAIAEALYHRNGEAEGKMAQRLNALVCKEMCADIARDIELSRVIRLGKQAREDGSADSDNILGDVMEALLGAHFIELGFNATRDLILRLWADAIDGEVGTRKHPKSALQEWAAGNRRRPPEYTLLHREGPDHAARFTVRVEVHKVGEAEATAASKQAAEKLAAQKFMEQFG